MHKTSIRPSSRRFVGGALGLSFIGCHVASCAAPAPVPAPGPAMTPPAPPPAAAPPVAQPAAPAGKHSALFGPVWTGLASAPRGSGLAWTADRVDAVFPDGVEIHLAPGHDLVALPHGAFVVPGLVDAHAHLAGLGRSLMQIGLRGDKLDDIAAKVRKAHAERPAGEWITGRGWDQNLWSPPVFPGKRLLDEAAPGRPVFLRRVDGHAGWASSRALELAGIGKDTRDPPGGRLVRDKSGAPTGVLVDNAMELLGKVLPDPGESEMERAVLLAQDDVLSRGLTTVHEMGIGRRLEAIYRRLDAAGKLRVRVYAMLDDSDDVLARLAVPPEPDDPHRRFHLAGVKLYADGALGSRGAALLAPYSDDPTQSGLVTASQAHIAEIAKAALRTGWQVSVHAIGDRGNRMTLDAFEEALRAVPDARDPRLRVEHAQILDPADIPRFAKLGVMASMQPTHATSDMAWVPARLGPHRLAGAYAWQSLIKAGAHLCAGSDFPVELPDPILGLYAAVTRQDGEGHPAGGWLPSERLSPDQALRAFTGEAAYCAHRDKDFGVLRPGAVADVTIFDRDLTRVPPAQIKDAKVVATIVGGVVEYRAK